MFAPDDVPVTASSGLILINLLLVQLSIRFLVYLVTMVMESGELLLF